MENFNQYYEIQKERLKNATFGRHEIDRVVSKENEPAFIQCLAKMQHEKFDVENGFEITFKDESYKQFSKRECRW